MTIFGQNNFMIIGLKGCLYLFCFATMSFPTWFRIIKKKN